MSEQKLAVQMSALSPNDFNPRNNKHRRLVKAYQLKDDKSFKTRTQNIMPVVHNTPMQIAIDPTSQLIYSSDNLYMGD